MDAAFAVHPDMKSHTGAVFTFGKGAIISDSSKQKPMQEALLKLS